MNILINTIKNLDLITVKKGKIFYHGHKLQNSQQYFRGGKWLSTNQNYALIYAQRDLNNKNIVQRELLICKSIKDMKLVDMTSVSLPELSQELNITYRLGCNDYWIVEHFVENAKKAFNCEIDGYVKWPALETNEYFINSVETNLHILQTNKIKS